MTIQQEIVTALLDKYPKHGIKTIARIAYKENPKVFKNLECAYATARRQTGSQKGRRAIVTHPREPGKPGDPFGEIPKPRNPFSSKWEALQISDPSRWLVCSDIHIPFHDPALTDCMNYAKKNGVQNVVLNGDIIDCHAVSRWEKDPRKRDFPGEVRDTRQFLHILRSQFKGRIIFKVGNHEERWESYMFAKAPECLGMAEFELENILKLPDLDIEIVKEKRCIRLGLLNLIHGHEYRFAISNPVSPARGLLLRAKAYAMCGHFHQNSYQQNRSIEQRHIAAWSLGCLCQLHQDYAPYNEWIHSFAIVDIAKDNKFDVQQKIISHGKIF